MQYYKKYYTEEQKQEVDLYIAEMNELELKAMNIALEHLKTSFDLLKTSGFANWKKKMQKSNK